MVKYTVVDDRPVSDSELVSAALNLSPENAVNSNMDRHAVQRNGRVVFAHDPRINAGLGRLDPEIPCSGRVVQRRGIRHLDIVVSSVKTICLTYHAGSESHSALQRAAISIP